MENKELLIRKVFKLSNGETIIANVKKETVSYIEIDDPLKFVMYMTNSGKLSITILKWDPTFNTQYPVRIYKTSIVACAEPTSDIIKNYDEIIDSGLHLEERIEEDTEEETLKSLLKTHKSDIIH
jgi:hypothetical protein